MPDKTLILLTDSFPFGSKETFLESEMVFLARQFSDIHIFPLHGTGSFRTQAPHVNVHEPFLPFHTKEQRQLLRTGLINCSPWKFAFADLIAKKAYQNPQQLRVWLAALLIFRAAYANKKRLSELCSLLHSKTILYSYWGDKLSSLIPFLRKENCNFQSVVRFHGTDLYEERKYGYIPFRSSVFPAINHFIFISTNGESYLSHLYPQWVHPTHLFRLGVFDHGLNPTGSPILHLVSCSYMVPIKRIPLLIEALNQIDDPIKWTHIGSGPQWNAINEQVGQLSPNIQVELRGDCTNSEVLEYYKHTPIDLFINISESEGVPVSIMEALSFGIPVIATDAGGTSEIVDNSVGTLLPVQTTSAEIASAIKQTQLRNTDLRLRQNARKRWKERCDAELQYESFAAFLYSI